MADPQQQQQASSQQTTPSPADVMSDPEFLSKDVGTKHQILLRVDPEGYGKMPRLTQDAVLSRLSKQAGQPQGRPVTVGPQSTGARKAAEEEVGGTIMAVPSLVGETAQHPLKTAVTFGKEFFAQPLRELAGEPQPGEDRSAYEKQYPAADAQGFHRANLAGRLLNAGASTLGGNPAAAREAFAKGDTSGAVAHLLTVPLLTAGVGGLLKTAKKEVAATRKEVSSLQTISKGAITGKGPADAAGRVAEMQRVVKQVLAQRGITDESLKKMFPTAEKAGQADLVGDVARGNQLILDVARDAVGFVHQPIDAVMSRYGPHPAGAVPSRVAKSLADTAKDIGKVNPPLSAAINELAAKVKQAKSFDELNALKQHANKMLDTVYSPVPGRAIDATAERAYAYKLAADAIRSEMYPELQRLSGGSIDLAKLGQREADAIALRDGIFEHYLKEVSPAQMSKEAAGFWEYTLAGQGAPGHSYYSRHILGRAAEKGGVVPTGGAEFSRKFRRGAGPIGEGMTPEKVSLIPAKPGVGVPVTARGFQVTPRTAGQPLIGTGAAPHFLEITHGGQAAGHVMLNEAVGTARAPVPKGSVEVVSSSIQPGIRRQGFGTALYDAAAKHAKAEGANFLVSDVNRTPAAESLWKSFMQQNPQGIHYANGRYVLDLKHAGVEITPYKAGKTQRFKAPVAKAAAAGRAAGAAREVRRKGMTPPPSESAQDEEPE